MIDRLRARGIEPKLVSGYNSPVWEQNAFLDGLGSSVNAVMVHDTGTSVPASRLQNTHSLNWIVNGVKNSRGQTVRACHLYIARNGDVYIVYARRTWHAGAGDSMFGIPANRMNGYSYGIEIESQGGGVADLTAAQISRGARVVAALLDVSGLGLDRIINHKDYAGRVQGKVDTAYSRAFWQNKVAAVMSQDPDDSTPPDDDPEPTPKPDPNAPIYAALRANPKAVSLSLTRLGQSNISVARYQRAVRALAASLKLPVKKLNPSGPTGYFGDETRRLTVQTYAALRKRSAIWRKIVPKPVPYPINQLVRRAGRIPIR